MYIIPVLLRDIGVYSQGEDHHYPFTLRASRLEDNLRSRLTNHEGIEEALISDQQGIHQSKKLGRAGVKGQVKGKWNGSG